MRLRYWTRAFREVEFDPCSGVAQVVRLGEPRKDSDPIFGFASAERTLLGRRHWFALYRSGETIVLQSGLRKWVAADPKTKFHHSRPLPFLSRFEVRVEGRSVFSILYANLGRLLFAFIDPTYDRVDQESDFLLEFIADNANTPGWRDYVLEQWHSSPAA